jgi:hypothetical protein
MSNQAIQKIEPQQGGQIVPLNDGAALMAVIAKAATDPNCDVDKMERLFALHREMQSQQAVVEYNTALSEMQTELPSIAERGNAAGRYTFALWEDINAAIKPVLQRHGFALTFRTDFTDGIAVTGVLSHKAGHSESTTIKLPADPSGNKNAVQAVASSVSYGKRYTAGALLNLTSHGEDDDAYTAAVERINDEQAATIRDMLEATGSDARKFLAWLKVDSIEAIPAKAYQTALTALRQKERAK